MYLVLRQNGLHWFNRKKKIDNTHNENKDKYLNDSDCIADKLELSGEVPNDGSFPDDILSSKFIETSNDSVIIIKDATIDQLNTELYTDSIIEINSKTPA